jgi:hypothetical protein
MARKVIEISRGQTLTINGKRLYAVSGRIILEQRIGQGERVARVSGKRKSKSAKR